MVRASMRRLIQFALLLCSVPAVGQIVMQGGTIIAGAGGGGGGGTPCTTVTNGVQYNNAGAFGCSPTLTFNPISGLLNSTLYAASVGTQITAASTITPTHAIQHVTGGTPIVNITVPAGMSAGGTITLIPDSVFTWTTAGNISTLGQSEINVPITFTFDGTKWSPSYVATLPNTSTSQSYSLVLQGPGANYFLEPPGSIFYESLDSDGPSPDLITTSGTSAGTWTDVNVYELEQNGETFAIPNGGVNPGAEIQLVVSQPTTGGGPYTLGAGASSSPLSNSGGGLSLVNLVPGGCPTIGTNIGATAPSKLLITLEYNVNVIGVSEDLPAWYIKSCVTANPVAPPTSSVAFSAITPGINTGGSLQVGTGSTLAPTGSGTISANALIGSPAITVSNATDSALTPGNCVQAGTAGLLVSTGAACGSSGGSGPTIQTNAVNNASQASLNFTNTSTVLFTNPSVGLEEATVPTATTSALGLIKSDNTTTTITAGAMSIKSPAATTVLGFNSSNAYIGYTAGSNISLAGGQISNTSTANTLSSTLTTGTLPVATGANSIGNSNLSQSGGSLLYNPGSGSTILGSNTASNVDGWGELSLSAATTASYTFANTYAVHPECFMQLQFNEGASVSHWVTYTGSTSFTMNFSSAVTGTVSYHCDERD
jgi:hypothetical protein